MKCRKTEAWLGEKGGESASSNVMGGDKGEPALTREETRRQTADGSCIILTLGDTVLYNF